MSNKNELASHLLRMKKISAILEEKKNLIVTNLNLGQGGQGSVISAYDHAKQMESVIKILSVYDGVDSVDIKKLENAEGEAEILKKQQHPGIVKYINSFLEGTNYFIQMEKCSSSLQEWLDRTKGAVIKRETFIDFSMQILDAIEYLHNNNLLVRDISLRNILLDDKNRIKLCDFGLAKEINPLIATQQFYTSSAKGVFFFFPPEIFDQKGTIEGSKIQNFQGDVWAYGICLYLLAGAQFQHVYKFTNLQEQYQQQIAIDSDLNQFIQNILIFNPLERPTIQQIKCQLKDISITLDQKDTTLSTLSNIKLANSNGAIEFFQQGESYSNKQMYDDAIYSFKASLKINPHNDHALSYIGYLYNEKQMPDEAIEWCLKGLIINPNNEYAHNNIGNAYNKKQMPDEAIEWCKKCLIINPNNDNAHNIIGNAYNEKNMIDKAIEQHLKCLEINPNNEYAYNFIGNAYNKKQMPEQAIEWCKKCLKINPNNDDAHNNIANAYNEKKMLDEAIEWYKKCIQINPNNEFAYNNIGNAYNNKKMPDQAIEWCKKCLVINPNNEYAHNNIGNAYNDKQMPDEAIKWCKKSLEINPNNEYALNNIGNAYYKKKMPSEAINWYKKSLVINPNNAFANNELKQIFVLEKKYNSTILKI